MYIARATGDMGGVQAVKAFIDRVPAGMAIVLARTIRIDKTAACIEYCLFQYAALFPC